MSPFSRLAMYITDPDALKQGPEQLNEMVEALGLNDPAWVQYGRWMSEVLHGNFGWSESARQPVLRAIGTLLPASVELTLFAAFPVIFLGIWLGKISAVHQDTLTDHISRVTAIIGWSFPTFVFGILALMIFYAALGWFPPTKDHWRCLPRESFIPMRSPATPGCIPSMRSSMGILLYSSTPFVISFFLSLHWPT